MSRRAFIAMVAGTFVALIACQKTSSTPLTRKCTSDADCVWETKSRGDCCVNPCGGAARPVHRDESQSIQKYNDEHCTTERPRAVSARRRVLEASRRSADDAAEMLGGCMRRGEVSRMTQM